MNPREANKLLIDGPENILNMTIKDVLMLKKELGGSVISLKLEFDESSPIAGLFITTEVELIKKIAALIDSK